MRRSSVRDVADQQIALAQRNFLVATNVRGSIVT
jgi:hypothetical protein